MECVLYIYKDIFTIINLLPYACLGLGNAGIFAQVKPGYARNYLIPKGFAVYATKENMLKHSVKKVGVTGC